MLEAVHDGSAGDGAPPRRRLRRWILGIVVALLVLLVVAAVAAFVLWQQAQSVRDELEEAKAQLETIGETVASGDEEAFAEAADEVLAHTTRADETVRGPLWQVASVIPVIGGNVAAVQKVTEATQVLVRDALPASLDVLSIAQADGVRLDDGGFNLDLFRQALDTLPQINAAFDEAEAIVADVDADRLLPVVDDAVGQVLDVIAEAGPMLRGVERVLPTALQLAGDSEPRTYLVIVQNNAEIRATGGVPSASMLLHVDDGRVEIGEQLSSTTFADELGLAGQSFLDLDPEMLALYDPELTTFSQNYTRTPNFPTTAALFEALLAAGLDEHIDGVISLDPVVLSYILSVTGPVPLEDDGDTVTDENVVTLLLSEVYQWFPDDGWASDAFFADVAARVFDKIVGGAWSPTAMIDQLMRARDEQRLYAWFLRDDEQALTVELGIDGAMATDNVETTQVGVFLNDAAVSKLGYYLSTDVTVACDQERRTMTTTITMASAVPDVDLGYYTLGLRNPRFGLPGTSMILDALYFAPPGATIDGSDPAVGDIPEWDRSGRENGRDAVSIAVVVPSGESRTVSFTSTLPDGPLGPVSVRFSPTVTETPVEIAPACLALGDVG